MGLIRSRPQLTPEECARSEGGHEWPRYDRAVPLRCERCNVVREVVEAAATEDLEVGKRVEPFASDPGTWDARATALRGLR